MRGLLGSALVVATATNVHAMGTSTTFTLVAWNDDGSAALLEAFSSFDNDGTQSYEVVAANDPSPTMVAISHHVGDPAYHPEEIDRPTCRKALDTLAHELAAHAFHGVTIHRESCDHERRNAGIVISPAATRDVESSWVPLAMGREATVRETASWKAARTAFPDLMIRYPRKGDGTEWDVDIANKSGRMILVLAEHDVGSPEVMHVAVLVPGPSGYVMR